MQSHRLWFKIYLCIEHKMNIITNYINICFSPIDDLRNELERRYEDANKDACLFLMRPSYDIGIEQVKLLR